MCFIVFVGNIPLDSPHPLLLSCHSMSSLSMETSKTAGPLSSVVLPTQVFLRPNRWEAIEVRGMRLNHLIVSC